MWIRGERERRERERETHLSFGPVVLFKDVVIHCSRPVGHQHYGLAAHAAASSLVKLQKERKYIKTMIKNTNYTRVVVYTLNKHSQKHLFPLYMMM